MPLHRRLSARQSSDRGFERIISRRRTDPHRSGERACKILSSHFLAPRRGSPTSAPRSFIVFSSNPSVIWTLPRQLPRSRIFPFSSQGVRRSDRQKIVAPSTLVARTLMLSRLTACSASSRISGGSTISISGRSIPCRPGRANPSCGVVEPKGIGYRGENERALSERFFILRGGDSRIEMRQGASFRQCRSQPQPPPRTETIPDRPAPGLRRPRPFDSMLTFPRNAGWKNLDPFRLSRSRRRQRPSYHDLSAQQHLLQSATPLRRPVPPGTPRPGVRSEHVRRL